MKKNNMDLYVGLSIFMALFILIAGVLFLKDQLVAKKMVSFTLLFPNVGSLQLGDPIMVNGVTKGRVAAMYLRKSKVATIINLEHTVPLTDSCTITVQNVGLMGERGIGIQLNEAGTRFKPSKKKDTTFIAGDFDTGIAEAMGMAGTVLTDVQVLLGNVAVIMNSTIGDTAFLRIFHTLVNRLDTLTLVADRLARKNEPLIDNSIQNLSTASTQLKMLLDNNSGHIGAIMSNGEKLSEKSLVIAERAESLTVSLQTILNGINEGKGTVGMLVKDEAFKNDLKQTIIEVDTLLNSIQQDALKLRVKYGFGKKKK